MYENSVNESPCSRLCSRSRTESFWIIMLTEKCLPVSRSTSTNESDESQSALLTSAGVVQDVPRTATSSDNNGA